MTPVIDLADQRAVDGYEHPTTMKTRTRLRSPADAFPGSVTRTHHRAKTHLPNQVR